MPMSKQLRPRRVLQTVPTFLQIFTACWLVSTLLRAVEPGTDERLPLKEPLELWLDCSSQNVLRSSLLGLAPLGPGDLVDRLVDGSGHARHLTQLQRNSRPKFGQDGGSAFLVFDGVDDALTVSGLQTTLTGATVFVVMSPQSNEGMFPGLFSLHRAGQNDYTSGMNCDLGPAPTAQFSVLNIEGAGFGGSSQFLKTPPLSFGSWHVLCARCEVGRPRCGP